MQFWCSFVAVSVSFCEQLQLWLAPGTATLTPENAEVYQRPTLMPDACLDDLIGYVQQALLQAPVRRVVFGFHGGEPTLAKAAKVRPFCTAARERLQPHVDVDFTLQTNGVHLSEDWLQLISEQGMGVGISIDGDRALHDRYRIDHQDRGSYDRKPAQTAIA